MSNCLILCYDVMMSFSSDKQWNVHLIISGLLIPIALISDKMFFGTSNPVLTGRYFCFSVELYGHP